MKGIIFNLVEGVVRTEHGDTVWDEVVDESGVTGAYTSLGSYPDEDLLAIAGAVAVRLGTDPSDVVRHVGHESFGSLVERYPDFFAPHDNLRSFLMSLNSVIHIEVRKLYPGSIIPDFEYRSVDADVLELVYHSARGRCDLAEGLILGAADHFGQQVELSQPECVHRADPRCVLRVRFG